MKENFFKILLSTAIAGLAAYFHVLAVPLIILLTVMLIDYLTGMTRAWMTKSFSSRIGIKGIVKKILYLALVAVGMVVDYLITGVLQKAGVTVTVTGVIGLIVTIWLIINELISILENLAQAGVPVPEFLVKLIKKLKVSTEAKGSSFAPDEKEKDPEQNKR